MNFGNGFLYNHSVPGVWFHMRNWSGNFFHLELFMTCTSTTEQHRTCLGPIVFRTLNCFGKILIVLAYGHSFQGCNCHHSWKPILRYGTFNFVYKKRWQDVLRFRQKSLFTQCEVCWTLKSELSNKTISMEHKLGSLKLYREHLHQQFCDRSTIWKLQSESQDVNTDFVIISTDGLDQSKFALPRDPKLRATAGLISGFFFSILFMFFLLEDSEGITRKSIWNLKVIDVENWFDPDPATFISSGSLRAKHQRPRVKVHGAWAFGYSLNVYIMDESHPHDSSAIIEILSATLEDVSRQSHTPI